MRNIKTTSTLLVIVFSLVLALFSLDFGVVKFRSSRIHVLIKSLCFFQTISISFLITYFYIVTLTDVIYQCWFIMYIFEYCALVIILLFSDKTLFSNFYNDLLTIYDKLGVTEFPKLEIIILTWVISSFVYRCMLTILYCTILKEFCLGDVYIAGLFFVSSLCGDVFLIVGFVIYYLLYCQLKVFTSFVRKCDSNVVSCLFIYKSIADVADTIKPKYNAIYGFVLILHTIDLMITIFYPLISIEKPLNISTIMSVLHLSFMVFSPAFAAGLLSSQVDQLRVVLQNRMLQERGSVQIPDLEKFDRYIEFRSLRTIIWKVIPLDWQLPVIIINICVTYLIVILQFSHKY